jgi:hypothetical protein
MEARLMFEGIATLDIAGVEHDVYMTAQVEILDDVLVRWFGTVGWIGEAPKRFEYDHVVDGTDVRLSDGRKGTIQLPLHGPSEDGKAEFIGRGLPPGFEPLYQRAVLATEPVAQLVTAELRSTTPSRVPSFVALALAVASVVLFFQGIWAEDDMWRYVASGLVLSFVSLCFAAYGGRVKPLPEADND